MLVLTRKTGEKLMIGDNVEVCILGVFGNQVRIGVEAPKSVVVDRAEVREKRDAGIPHPSDKRKVA